MKNSQLNVLKKYLTGTLPKTRFCLKQISQGKAVNECEMPSRKKCHFKQMLRRILM